MSDQGHQLQTTKTEPRDAIAARAEQTHALYEGRFTALEKEVASLSQRVDELRRVQPMVVPVTNILSDEVSLIRSFMAVVQRDEDDYIATFFDANISGSGESDVEAVDALKEIMVAKFLKFDSLGPDKLGRQPTRELNVLRTVMQRVR